VIVGVAKSGSQLLYIDRYSRGDCSYMKTQPKGQSAF
jgi:hypothetical protein